MVNLGKRELAIFAKIFLASIHICTDCSLFAKCFLANRFYLYGLPKFPLPNISHVWYIEFKDHDKYIITYCSEVRVLIVVKVG